MMTDSLDRDRLEIREVLKGFELIEVGCGDEERKSEVYRKFPFLAA